MPDWYVHNVGEFPWFVNEKFGARGFLVPFDDDVQIGVRVHVLEPGKPSTLYHRETAQEGFLVVEGECLLIVEGEERRLKAWDYFHCPPGTTHAFVGAGDGPCVMVTLGLRGGTIQYLRDEPAIGCDAAALEETAAPSEAYEPFPKWEEGQPESWPELPWNRDS